MIIVVKFWKIFYIQWVVDCFLFFKRYVSLVSKSYSEKGFDLIDENIFFFIKVFFFDFESNI